MHPSGRRLGDFARVPFPVASPPNLDAVADEGLADHLGHQRTEPGCLSRAKRDATEIASLARNGAQRMIVRRTQRKKNRQQRRGCRSTPRRMRAAEAARQATSLRTRSPFIGGITKWQPPEPHERLRGDERIMINSFKDKRRKIQGQKKDATYLQFDAPLSALSEVVQATNERVCILCLYSTHADAKSWLYRRSSLRWRHTKVSCYNPRSPCR